MQILKFNNQGKFHFISSNSITFTEFNDKGKKTVSDNIDAYTKFCVINTPDHIVEMV